MIIKLRKKMAQSTTEYAILLGVIIAAIAAMQTYVKRSFQAKVRDVSDTRDLGGGVQLDNSIFATRQYEPYYLQSDQQKFSAQRQQKQYIDGESTVNSQTAAGTTGTTTYQLDSNVNENELQY